LRARRRGGFSRRNLWAGTTLRHFSNMDLSARRSQQIGTAVTRGKLDDVLKVLGGAMTERRETAKNLSLVPCESVLRSRAYTKHQGACQEGPDQSDQFRLVIEHGEAFLAKHPVSEVSDRIRLEVANAYATWWNIANMEPDAYTEPTRYKTGAAKAKQHSIELYKAVPECAEEPQPGYREAAEERTGESESLQ
jgi:hypothetical protein